MAAEAQPVTESAGFLTTVSRAFTGRGKKKVPTQRAGTVSGDFAGMSHKGMEEKRSPVHGAFRMAPRKVGRLVCNGASIYASLAARNKRSQRHGQELGNARQCRPGPGRSVEVDHGHNPVTNSGLSAQKSRMQGGMKQVHLLAEVLAVSGPTNCLSAPPAAMRPAAGASLHEALNPAVRAGPGVQRVTPAPQVHLTPLPRISMQEKKNMTVLW